MGSKVIDEGLLDRLADTINQYGRLVKSYDSRFADITNRISGNEIGLKTEHEKLNKLEDIIRGNGGDGLQTDLALIKQVIESVKQDIADLKEWKEDLSNKTVNDLKEQSKTRLTMMVAIGSLIIAFLSLLGVGNCAQNWVKANTAPVSVEKSNEG